MTYGIHRVAATLALCLAASSAEAQIADAIGDLLGGGQRSNVTRASDRMVATTGSIRPQPLPPVTAAPVDVAPVAPMTAPAAPARPKIVPRPTSQAKDAYPIDLLISLANDAVYSADPYPKGLVSDPRMIKLQVLLDRNNASPGVIDGMHGDNVVKAVRAFEEMIGHKVDGAIDAELWAALEATNNEPVLVPYVITAEDVAGPFVPDMPQDYALQAQLPGLSYRDAAEMLGERFHMDEAFLRRINPDVTFAEAGVEIMVANVGKPLKTKVASIIADKGLKQIRGYSASGKLVVAYPATIGSSDLPSPTGQHAVKAIAINPDYWYRPKVNFVQGANTKALRLPPGPNAPVGATWVGLDKPTYGMHGTPEPSKIDKTNSHGCVRLTNWDARELAGLVQPGVPVDFQEPPGVQPPVAEEPVAEEPVAPMAEQTPDLPTRDDYYNAPAEPPQRYEAEPPRRIPPLSERRAAVR